MSTDDARREIKNEQALYFAARDRALARHIERIEFVQEAHPSFMEGLQGAFDRITATDLAADVVTETNQGFAIVCGLLARIEAVKGTHYAASWEKRGEVGILANVQRKFDRLDNLLPHEGVSEGDESITETLGDLAVYSIKWLTRRAMTHPLEFEAWIKRIQTLKGPDEQRAPSPEPETEA